MSLDEVTNSTSLLFEALLAFQAEAVTLQKDAVNPHFKNAYIGLDSLMEAVLPLLNKHGLVVLQPVSIADGQPALTTVLAHAESGQHMTSQMFLVLDKDSPQGQGSAITYARRYGLMALLGLVADTDDDGQSAGTTKTSYKKTAVKRKSSGVEQELPLPDGSGTLI